MMGRLVALACCLACGVVCMASFRQGDWKTAVLSVSLVVLVVKQELDIGKF